MFNEYIIQHNINPTHKKEIEDFNFMCEGVDSVCGDDVKLYLKVTNGIIEDAGYTGYGCAISQAAADIMIDKIIGRSIEYAKSLVPEEEIKMLNPADNRKKCALLSWNTLGDILKM